jgi:hypothetical protein
MRLLLQIVSWAALATTIAPAVLFLTGHVTLDQTKWSMLLATIVWFAATPLWMGRPKVQEELVI